MKKNQVVQGEKEIVLHQNVARLRGRLTPVQSRSMLSILKRANEVVTLDPDVREFQIPTKTFLEDIQNKDTASTSIIIDKVSKHLEKLMTQLFEWGTSEEINKAVFMQQVKITEHTVTFKFSDYIREHIKPISNVLIIRDFELLQSFRSEYARQLYKHLMMWEKKQSCYLSIEDLKDFLGVPTTKSYERIEVLKRRVINVAVDEINEKKPDMHLEYVHRKDGRKIVGFNFGWFLVKKNNNSLFEEDELKNEFIDYIGKYCDKDSNGNGIKILTITPFDNPKKYRVSTPIGDYIFQNIETLRNQIKGNN